MPPPPPPEAELERVMAKQADVAGVVGPVGVTGESNNIEQKVIEESQVPLIGAVQTTSSPQPVVDAQIDNSHNSTPKRPLDDESAVSPLPVSGELSEIMQSENADVPQTHKVRKLELHSDVKSSEASQWCETKFVQKKDSLSE